jgi:hypothetical protein
MALQHEGWIVAAFDGLRRPPRSKFRTSRWARSSSTTTTSPTPHWKLHETLHRPANPMYRAIDE